MQTAASKVIGPLADAIRLTPVRPALATGLRAATATIAPLVLGALLGRHELTWSALAGFLAALVDKGGAYAARARALLAFAVAAAILAPLAGLVGNAPVVMVPAILVSASALGFLRVYGGTAGSVGALLLVMVVVSLAQPATGATAVARGGWILLGASWAAGLSLFMWPVRPYRPARAAAARVLRAIAAYARGPGASSDVEAWSRTQRAAIRQAIEEARITLAATRRGRRGDTGRGARLLALLDTSDRLFGAAVALSEHADERMTEASEVLAQVATLSGAAADVVESEHKASAVAVEEEEALPTEAFARMLARPRLLANEAFALALSIEDGRSLPRSLAIEREPWSLLEPLRANWTLRSSLMRHALRAGVATSSGALLASVAGLQRGQWVTLAIAVILQPQLPATFLRATQRVLGTVAGALMAAALTGVIETPWATLPVMFMFAAVGVAVQPLSYALYSTFLTPTFVLLAEASTHDPSLVMTRIVNTLIGGGVALLAARFLWPISERDIFPESARAVLAAARHHLQVVISDEPAAMRARARREVGLALLNAETSLNRWLAEVNRRATELEAPLALIAQVRRLSAATLALAELTTPEASRRSAAFFDAVDEALGEMMEAGVRDKEAQVALEALIECASDALDEQYRRALTRVAETVIEMQSAVARWQSGQDNAGH